MDDVSFGNRLIIKVKSMIDARVFDDISKSLSKLLPPGVSDLKDDFERNAKAAMQSALGNLDLVSREEFDVQAEVLRNTRQKLKMLEARVSALEPAIEAGGSPNKEELSTSE
ncbi:MAG: accessory factor UbiK family protein [Granulosicoccus sp.]